MRSLSLLPVAVALALVMTACGRLEPLSPDEALERLNVATSKVYDADGNVIANLHREINRDISGLRQIPRHVRDAVVAVEDERFWSHQGLDLRSIVRAAVTNIRAEDGAGIQGGSTISQQLAKNLYFPRPARTLARKIAEARVTWQLERQYTKPQILEMYLNTIYFGRGVYGVETASRSYFRKSASKLTLSEGAFLMGVIHEPARYEWTPSDPPERREARIRDARNRRNHVIERMRSLGMISEARAADAKAEPLDVEPAAEQRWTHPYFVDLVLRQLGVLGKAQLDPRFDFLGSTPAQRDRNVHLGGLRIYTTLDPRAQEAAEEAIQHVLPPDLEKLSAALASIEPRNGYVRALVGGRDYYPECEDKKDRSTHRCRLAKVNLALGSYAGGSGRQPGSSFKPFVLASALERGVPLYQTFDGSPFVHPLPFSKPWTVNNYDGAGAGSMTLVDGTARSVNAVFAHLEIDGLGDGDAMAGAARLAATARRLGISFATPEQLQARCGDDYLKKDRCIPADNVPATALGAREVSPFDMASAYAAFANDGRRVEPTTIVRIDDANGRTIYEAEPKRVQAIPAAAARGVTYALQQVIARGTGTRAAIDRPAAGKTGTSQQWRDAWFAGYVPQLATVLWVGNPIPIPDVGNESMVPSNGYPLRVVGGSYPAMIWHEFMTRVVDAIPVVPFPQPPQVLFRGAGIVQPSPSPLPSGSPSEDGATASVPSVIGMTFGAASSRIRAAGFDADTQRGCDPSGKSELHEVYSQSPEAGSPAPAGSRVRLFYQGGGCD